MKKLNKYIMFFAAAAMALASCSKEELNTTEPEGQEVPGTIKVRFGTETPITKAVSTTDDANFSSSWITGKDEIGVTIYSNATPLESNVYAKWDGDAFEAGFTGTYDPATTYQFKGVYPYSETGVVDFGNTRDQIYNAHNGKYDIMVSKAISSTLPAENTLILPMDRQTATVYFHLKSGFDEKVKSVTLVTDNDKPIAAVSATLDTENGYKPTTGDNCNFITLNIKNDGSNVMHTTDMQFWFNVLPVEGTSLKLIVESENRTFTMNKKANTTTWEAGHLYTTVLEGIPSEKWVEKAGEPEPVVVNYSLSSTGWSNDTKYTELVLDDNLKVTAAGGNNTGKFYTNDNTWRFYASENATATFSLKPGYTFKTATITYAVKDGGMMTYNDENVDSGSELEVDGLSEFSIGTTSTSDKSGKVLITNIYVKYVAGSEPFDPLNPSYAITVKSGIQNGTVKAINADSETITYAKAGDAVTLSAIPETGYALVAGSLKAINSVTEKKIDFTEGTTFTMPAANIIVEAAFEKAEYTVTGITGTDENHGSVSVNKGTAYYGDEIELTVTPDEGYRLKEGSLKINGSITPTQKVDGETPVENVFVFNMPAEDATVSATFEVIKYELSDQSGSHGRLEFYYPSDLTTAISEAASGESVKVVAVPVDATYQLKSGTLSVYKKGNTSVVYTLENNVFTMPANAVSATATFEDAVFNLEKDSASDLEFTIKNEQGDAIYSSIASRTGAVKTIRLEATGVPDDKQAKWTVTTAVGPVSTSTVTGNENAVTFMMPAADVKIKCVKGDKASTVTFSGADNADYKFPTGSDGLIENDNIIAKNVKVSFTGASSNSYYDGSVVRFYSGNTMTVAPLNGAVITKVEIVRQSTTSSNSGVISATINSVAQTVTGTTTGTNTWEGNTANPIVFTNNGQCRFTKVIVTYSGGSVVNVTSVTLDSPTMELNIGGDKTLTAIVYPDNATNKNVTWSSDKESVATVDQTGKVTGKAEGTATITATSVADGTKSASCTVSVTTGGGQGGGTPHTYTMTIDSSDNGSNNVHWTGSSVTSLTYDNVTWSTSVTGTTSFTASKTYCQVGSKSNPATKVSLTTSAFAGKTITSVKVTCYCSSNTGPTLTVTAGSTTMISGSALTKGTSTEMSSDTGVTATLGATEELSIVFNSSAKAAICISKIEVKYTD